MVYSAKVVIGDLDVSGAAKVVAEIEKAGGYVVFVVPYQQEASSYSIPSCLRIPRSAAWIKCNVTIFEEQVELFELAVKRFGSVDIVVRLRTPGNIK